jgi:hypothetical protein
MIRLGVRTILYTLIHDHDDGHDDLEVHTFIPCSGNASGTCLVPCFPMALTTGVVGTRYCTPKERRLYSTVSTLGSYFHAASARRIVTPRHRASKVSFPLTALNPEEPEQSRRFKETPLLSPATTVRAPNLPNHPLPHPLFYTDGAAHIRKKNSNKVCAHQYGNAKM